MKDLPYHHLPDGKFRNPEGSPERDPNFKWNMSKWNEEKKKIKINIPPDHVINKKEVLENLNKYKNDDYVAWIGHATFLIKLGDTTIITDPVFSKNMGPLIFGPKRYVDPAVDLNEIPEVNLFLLTHNHYDHLDYQTMLKIMRKQQGNPPLVLVPLKLKKLLQSFGASNVKELEWWESTSYKNLKIHSVPVQHWSNRSFNTNKTLWCGWIFETNNFKCIFVGDTGYSKDFEAIQKKFGFMDLALIPIGAYAPRWFMKDHHCNVEEAIQIHKDLKSKHSVAMHWGTFQLTDEPMDEPPKLLKKLVVEKKLLEDEFIVMTHGESKNI